MTVGCDIEVTFLLCTVLTKKYSGDFSRVGNLTARHLELIGEFRQALIHIKDGIDILTGKR